MTTSQLTLPPEEDWLPGRLLGSVVLHDSSRLNVVFDHADVYSVGILLHLTARFRDLRTLEAQREVGEQVMAFHHAADHDGPHLRYEVDGQLADALPWAHGGAQRLWRIGFWIARDAIPLEYELDWPAKAVRSAFSFTQEQIDEALSAARQLWPTQGDGHDGIRIAT
jgi:hypothetical protein